MAAMCEIPVLIVGGGPVGLCAAILLSHHGIPSLLVERHDATARYPKARFVNARSMEIFRQCGLERVVRETALPPDTARHAIWASSLVGEERQRVAIDTVTPEGIAGLSPTSGCTTSQEVLEPVLLAAARRGGLGEVRFGWELVTFAQDAAGVTATLLDRATGEQMQVRADYLIGADGPHSRVRELLTIPMVGRADAAHFVTILFRADLSPWVAGRSINLCMLLQAEAPGVLLAIDGQERWCLMANYSPAAGQRAEDFTLERCITLVRAAVGVPDLTVTIERVAPWSAAARVAERFSAGRVFLAGDAAHEMPPAGGFGMNVGIADAHNLAWKLAAVSQGWAGPSLLATYASEREPVGRWVTEQIGRMLQTMASRWRAGADRADATVGGDDHGAQSGRIDLFREVGMVFGAAYYSAAAVPDATTPTEVANPVTDYAPEARPGSRAPHVWLARAGERISTLDLFDTAFVLLAGPSGGAWCEAAEHVVSSLGAPLRAYALGEGGDLRDPEGAWPDVYGVEPDGAVLVRPDGHVAWRSRGRAEDAPGTLDCVLRSVLGSGAWHDEERRTGSTAGARSSGV